MQTNDENRTARPAFMGTESLLNIARGPVVDENLYDNRRETAAALEERVQKIPLLRVVSANIAETSQIGGRDRVFLKLLLQVAAVRQNAVQLLEHEQRLAYADAVQKLCASDTADTSAFLQECTKTQQQLDSVLAGQRRILETQTIAVIRETMRSGQALLSRERRETACRDLSSESGGPRQPRLYAGEPQGFFAASRF